MKFKIGDIVIIKDYSKRLNNKKGKIVGIKKERGQYGIAIEFFDYIDGHDGGWGSVSLGKPGYCWNLSEEYIELYKPILKKFIEEMEKNNDN